ncbi:MAG: helix-turn-helix domain-containing protein [Planctomycetes bacterium]|nr:helix-turn-helix domain-containing protein [Planctomycetota bacterium]
MKTKELLTTKELAEQLKVSPHTIKLWSKEGKIPTVWLGRTCRRFYFNEVLEALRKRRGSEK